MNHFEKWGFKFWGQGTFKVHPVGGQTLSDLTLGGYSPGSDHEKGGFCLGELAPFGKI